LQWTFESSQVWFLGHAKTARLLLLWLGSPNSTHFEALVTSKSLQYGDKVNAWSFTYRLILVGSSVQINLEASQKALI